MKPHAHFLMRVNLKSLANDSVQFNLIPFFLYILPNYNNIHFNEHAFSQYDLLFLITSIFKFFCNHNGDGESSETSGWHYCRCIHLYNCLWFGVIFQWANLTSRPSCSVVLGLSNVLHGYLQQMHVGHSLSEDYSSTVENYICWWKV